MMRILQSEMHIGNQAAPQALQRIAGLLQNSCQMLRKPRERFVANLLEKFCFVREVKVDGSWRVLNLVGDAPHGNVLVALLDEQFTGSVKDLLAEEFLLAKFAFFYTQVEAS